MNRREKVRLILVYALCGLFVCLLQVLWPSRLTLSGIRPDLALVFTAAVGYLYGMRDGAAVGLGCGFLLDMQSGRLLGLGMLLLLLAGMLPDVLYRRLFKRPVVFVPAAVLPAAILFHLFTWVASYLLTSLTDQPLQIYLYQIALDERIGSVLLMDLILSLPLAGFIKLLGPYRTRKTEYST